MLPKENKTLKRKKEQIEPEMKKMKCENDDLRSELSVSMSQNFIFEWWGWRKEWKCEREYKSEWKWMQECEWEQQWQINKTFFSESVPSFFNVIFG